MGTIFVVFAQPLVRDGAYTQASRKDIDELLKPKLPEVLSPDQKGHKVRNLLQAMRRDGVIENTGDRGRPAWQLKPD